MAHKKTCHYVFDYHSGISWAIVTLSVPVKLETGIITLQSTYFMAFRGHICATLHITRVYFLRSCLKIKKCCIPKVHPDFKKQDTLLMLITSQTSFTAKLSTKFATKWSYKPHNTLKTLLHYPVKRSFFKLTLYNCDQNLWQFNRFFRPEYW